MPTEKYLDITQSPRTKNNWRMVTKEYEKRLRALYRSVPYAAAKELYDTLLVLLPAGSDFRDLKQGLKISEIGGINTAKGGAWAVHVPTKAKRIKKIDVPKTVLYVRAKKTPKRVPPDVQVLIDRGPWTADTIPFYPKKSEAVVVQRKVTKREADEIAKAKKRALPEVRKELLRFGRRIKKRKPGDPGHIGRKGKAIPDVGMIALRLEFGEDGTRARPVFRPSLLRIRGRLRRLPDMYPEIKDALMSPNSRRWQTWPHADDKIDATKARRFMGFQKRLGYG